MRIARNAQQCVATPPRGFRAIRKGRQRLGMEKTLVCVLFAATESSSEVFDPSWSSGKPVVKVCHCNTQVAYDFLTHRLNFELVSELVYAVVLKGP